MAEDYAPFDVDVTTQQPTAAAIDRTNAADLVYGVRALISPSTMPRGAICSASAAAWRSSGCSTTSPAPSTARPRTSSTSLPGFSRRLTGGDHVKNIAEATTHEVGHNLGLDHDGFGGQNNYYGWVTTSWAPDHGRGLRPTCLAVLTGRLPRRVGLASLQPNPDDLVTIETFLSPTASDLRTDERGTAIGNAGAVPAGSAYITTRTDVDYFALGNCAGTVTVNANGAAVSPNLDIEAQLLNSAGTVIDLDNPDSASSSIDIASGMDASAQGTSLPSGQYYARIDGIGRGTPSAAYDDYGSIGAYTLLVTGCVAKATPRSGRRPRARRVGS